jgi:hypothetical protein
MTIVTNRGAPKRTQRTRPTAKPIDGVRVVTSGPKPAQVIVTLRTMQPRLVVSDPDEDAKIADLIRRMMRLPD